MMRGATASSLRSSEWPIAARYQSGGPQRVAHRALMLERLSGMSRHPSLSHAMNETEARTGIGAGGTRKIARTNSYLVTPERERLVDEFRNQILHTAAGMPTSPTIAAAISSVNSDLTTVVAFSCGFALTPLAVSRRDPSERTEGRPPWPRRLA
jgi:hypothetical protein